jgi:hypothetical protein
MKGILINSTDKTVTEIEVDGTLESFYKALDVEMIEAVSVPGFGLANGSSHIMYVDEEGLLKPSHKQTWFKLEGVGQQVFEGNGLILGMDYEEGEEKDCTIDLMSIKIRTHFTGK